MNTIRIGPALRRITLLQNHVRPQSTNSLSEDLLFDDKRAKRHLYDILPDDAPEYPSAYGMEIRVDHDARTVRFKTETMSVYEKITVFMFQKQKLRYMYPDYQFTEKHI